MAPSPFSPSIPTLQVAWDSVSMGLLKECPRKYLYSIVLGFSGPARSLHPEFGINYHSILEHFDRRKAEGMDFIPNQREAMREALSWDDSPFTQHRDFGLKNRFTLARTAFYYTDHFRDDPAETVRLADGSPAVELSFRLEVERRTPDGDPYLYCGHLDRLVSYNDRLWWMDRKTTKSALDESYFATYTPDNQMTGYFFASQVFLSEPAKGGLVDAVQLLANGSRFQRRPLHRSEGELEDWLKDLYFFFSLAEQFAESGHWPMNDKACNNYGGCPFRPICSKPKELREAFLAQQFEHRGWNPLEVRGT